MLYLDLETKPTISYTWGLFDQNVGLNQIIEDWSILAMGARWASDPEGHVMYMDLRDSTDFTDDRKIVRAVRKLLDEADVVVTQNGKAFDIKKFNARCLEHGLQPPSSFKQIDTYLVAKKHFSFTSNKLEYMSDKFCKKYKKLKHDKFPGFDLWKECLAGNKEAWDEMEKYNKHDVLSLEELHHALAAWDSSINFSLFEDDETCQCGGTDFKKNGFFYSGVGVFQRWKCTKCGHETRDRKAIKTAKRAGVVR